MWKEARAAQHPEGPAMLKLEHIRKFYGRFMALDDLSLTIGDGALFGFVGPNGAGKTTAMKIMTGILPADEGVLKINGTETGPGDPLIARTIGYIPDDPGNVRNLKVSEYMRFFADCAGLEGLEARKRIQTLLGYVELADREDFYVDALSRGMKQRLSLARALLADPPVLIMDEPTSGLDPRTRYEFKQIVGELSDQGKTIVISSHILSDISELCTDVAIIDQGKIVMSGNLMDVMGMVTSGNPVLIVMEGQIGKAVEFLKNEPEVSSMAVRRGEIMISFSGNHAAEALLLRKMVEAGLPVRSFCREKGSLESIFMQLTGRKDEKVIASSEDYEF